MSTSPYAEKLTAIESRYDELNRLMADPQVATDFEQLRRYAQERAEIADLVETYQQLKSTDAELDDTRAMLAD